MCVAIWTFVRAGRARELNSRYCVMGRQSSDSTAKERDNIQSEQIMRDAVKQIQEAVDRDPKAHTEAIQALQTDNWKKRWRKVLTVDIGI